MIYALLIILTRTPVTLSSLETVHGASAMNPVRLAEAIDRLA